MPKTKAKAAVAAKIYAVVGSDDAEVKHTAAELAEKLKPTAAGDFGLEVIDGATDNADQAAARIRSTVEALRTLPFFGTEKLVWLKNANFLGDDQKARSTSVQAALEELGETIDSGFGPEIIFLLSAIDVDKRRSFYKSLAKRAELQIFDKLGHHLLHLRELARTQGTDHQVGQAKDELSLHDLFGYHLVT